MALVMVRIRWIWGSVSRARYAVPPPITSIHAIYPEFLLAIEHHLIGMGIQFTGLAIWLIKKEPDKSSQPRFRIRKSEMFVDLASNTWYWANCNGNLSFSFPFFQIAFAGGINHDAAAQLKEWFAVSLRVQCHVVIIIIVHLARFIREYNN